MLVIGTRPLPDTHGACGFLSCSSFPNPLIFVSWGAVTKLVSPTTPSRYDTLPHMQSPHVAWNRATMSYREWQSGSRGQLRAVLNQAATVPADHLARVQGVMGRAIVNFTTRGIRKGLLPADQDSTMYNMKRIGAIDAQGRATQQEQLAGLIFAAVRHEAFADRSTVTIPSGMPSDNVAVAPTEPAAWPEIPMRYLIVVGLLLATVFLGGLSMAVRSREAKALVQLRHDESRWTVRMAT